jgi:ABC-type phosphate/phosphonate transport system ATPase subunit
MSPHGDATNSCDDLDPASKIASLLSMGVYTLSKEKQNKIVNSLRSRGIDSIIPPLPKIVLVGNQSSGKSALIEAISRIKLPSAMGTTTRCPMEIILKSSKALDGPHYTVSL